MAIQKLGKVSIIAKGNYISSEVYEKLDLVTFNGASYLCKKTCSGIEPIPGADTEYWQPFGQSVVVASQDKTGIVRPDGTSLVVKDSLTGRIGVGDARYIPFENEIMAAGNVSDAFVELDARIDEVQESISDMWDASITYLVGKYCIYNNSLWKCKVQHTNQVPVEGNYWTKVSVANEISSVNSNLESVNSSLTKLETSTNSIDGDKSNSYDVSLEKNAWKEFTAQQDGIYEIVCYGDFIIFTNNKNHEHISLGSTTGFHEIFPFSGSLKVKKGQNVSYYIGSNLTIVSSKIYY